MKREVRHVAVIDARKYELLRNPKPIVALRFADAYLTFGVVHR